SSLSSMSPDLATRPPSSMSWRVRSRRFTTQSRLSLRATLALSRCRAAVACRSAARVRASACASAACALKERSAPPAPILLRVRVLALSACDQQSGQLLVAKCIGTARNDQLAKLTQLALFKLLCLAVERLQLGIEIARLTHGPSPIAWGRQASYRGIRSSST